MSPGYDAMDDMIEAEFPMDREPKARPLSASAEPIDLEAIEQRTQAATAGPWVVEEIAGEEEDVFRVVCEVEPGLALHVHGEDMTEADAEFIAHARSDIPLLCSEVSRLRERVTALDNLLSVARDALFVGVPEQQQAMVEEIDAKLPAIRAA